MIAYLRSIWAIRFFWFNLVRMDIRARYRGSVLGLGWSLLQPIAMTIILTTVFSTLFGLPPYEYAPFVMSGLTCWNFLQSICVMGCGSFFQGEAYIRQVPAPMAIYPLRNVLSAGFHFTIAIGLVLGLALWVGRPIRLLPLLTLVPSTVLLMAFGWALAALFGLANVRFRDTHHLMEVGLQALYFLTPVMYKPEILIAKGLGPVIYFNPVVPFLNLFRDPILHGMVPSLMTYLSAFLIAVAFMTAAGLALWRCERRLIFDL